MRAVGTIQYGRRSQEGTRAVRVGTPHTALHLTAATVSVLWRHGTASKYEYRVWR
jgi:hypothetical protein